MDSTTVCRKNANLIKGWLKTNQRSQAYLSRASGIDNSLLNNVLQGRHGSPRTLRALAKYTKLPLMIYCTHCRAIIGAVATDGAYGKEKRCPINGGKEK